MHKYRVFLVVAGGLLFGSGAFRLLTQLSSGDLVALGAWLVVAVVLHDVLIAPATVGIGVALTRLPPLVRRYVQGALIVGALITVIAIPLIAREDTQPPVKAMLQRDYLANLVVLLGLVILVGAGLYLAGRLRAPPQSERSEGE